MASDGRHPGPPLLTAGDPAPVVVTNRAGPSPFLFIGDHAGNVIPQKLGTLGLGDADRVRHIAWDIGVAGLGAALSACFDATFIRQVYSRLVIDCNRDPGRPDAIPAVSDATPIPGNAMTTGEARAMRTAAIHAPYQDEIGTCLADRDARGVPSVLVALHSFTPRLAGGDPRPWQIGVLHDRGAATFARAFLASLQGEPSLIVGDNEPYRMDLVDYTVPRHAFEAGRPYVEIEVRQDLIATPQGQLDWAAIIAGHLERTWNELHR